MEPLQPQQGIRTELAGELPMLQHKAGSPSHYTTDRRLTEWMEYIATIFPSPDKISTQKYRKSTV